MTVVVDASVVVALLVDGGPGGTWAASVVSGEDLAAPQLLHVEVANVLRRAALAQDISDDVAALAHADLLDLHVATFSYEPLADRIWALRHNLTTYDAWYVAVAERLDAPLATLDVRLGHAPGIDCRTLMPPPP